MNEPPRLQRLAERVYGTLLRAYPGGFARPLEREMAAAFRCRCRTARERLGGRGVASVLARESLDLAWNALLEWGDARPATRGDEHLMDILLQDLRYAFRSLGRKPALAAVSIAILALAIGGTTGIFTLIDRLLVAAPPGIEAPREMVGFALRQGGELISSFSHPDFEYFRDTTEVFSGVVASAGLLLDLKAGAEPERVRGQIVSGDYFSVLGANLPLGRGFLAAEMAPAGGADVAVISYAAWRDRFAGDPEVLGSALWLNGHPFTVVGVAPRGFRGFQALDPVPEVWVPLSTQPVSMPADWQPLTSRDDIWLNVAARLRPGTSREEAQAAVDVAVARLVETYYADSDEDLGVVLTPYFSFSPAARGKVATVLSLLMGVVLLVLVIACANLAGLFLTRAASRRREMGIRLALGSSRGRVLRLLLIESVAIALGGGSLGLLVSGWVVELVVKISRQPLLVDVRPDLTVLGFALAVSLATGLLSGLAPGLQASRRDVASALKEGSGFAGRSRLRGRSLLVVAQVALSVVLLVASALFVRSMRSLQSIDPGFEPKGLLVTSIDLRPQGLGDDDTWALYRQFLEGVRALPGVRSATLTYVIPFSGHRRGGVFTVEGREPKDGIGRFSTGYDIVGPGYFETLGISLLQGRDFTFDDRAGSPGVSIVNQSLAREVWPGENPIGKRIWRGDGPPLEVVGVVEDVKQYSPTEDPEPHFYRPILQRFETRATALVRTAGAPELLIGPVREEVRHLNPNLPVYNVGTLDSLLDLSAAPYKTNATLTSLFGVLALALAAIGLYGLVAYGVTQRLREIGIRMALGAETGSVVRLMLVRGVVLVGAGLVLGIGLAALVTRFIAGMLYAVSPADPTSFAAAAVVLAGIALLACYLPARRASRVDPVEVLRVE